LAKSKLIPIGNVDHVEGLAHILRRSVMA
jgi:hypothetical protein